MGIDNVLIWRILVKLMYSMCGQLNKGAGRDKKSNRFEAFVSDLNTLPFGVGDLRIVLSI